MKKLKKILVVIVAIVMFSSVVLFAACGNGPGNVPVTGITIQGSDRTLLMDAGEATRQLQVNIEPGNATNRAVNWVSSTHAVATVSDAGLLTLHAEGQTYITATSAYNTQLSDTISVTVLGDVEIVSVTIEGDRTITMEAGTSTRILTADIETIPAGVTILPEWSSSNNNAVTVSSDGMITAVAQGTATITATAGTESDDIAVTVVAPATGAANWTRFESNAHAIFENPFTPITEVTSTIAGASGGSAVTDLSGGAHLTQFINSAATGFVDLRIAVANAVGQAAFTLNSDNFSVYVNGHIGGTIPSTQISAANAQGNNWQVITVSGIYLTEGSRAAANEISLRFDNSLNLNLDYIEINDGRLGGAVSIQNVRTQSQVYSAPTCVEYAFNNQRIQAAPGPFQNIRWVIGEPFATAEPLGHDFPEWVRHPDRFPDPVSGERYAARECKRCGVDVSMRLGKADFHGFVAANMETVIEWAAANNKTKLTTFMPSDAFVAIPAGLNNRHALSWIEHTEQQHIANISGEGNYVQFDLFVEQATEVDLSLRIANTFTDYPHEMLSKEKLTDFFHFRLYNGSPESLGHFVPEVDPTIIRTPHPEDPGAPNPTHVHPPGHPYAGEEIELDPDDPGFDDLYRDYRARLRNRQFMNTVDNVDEIRRENMEDRGLSFNFDVVSFERQDGVNWFQWKYIVVEGVTLAPGLNTIVFRSNPDAMEGDGTTIPNVSRMLMFSADDADISIVRGMRGMTAEETFDTGTNHRHEFTKDGDVFTTGLGRNATGDLVLSVAVAETIPFLVTGLDLILNGTYFNLVDVAVNPNTMYLVFRDISLLGGGQMLEAIAQGTGITIVTVAFYAETEIPPAYTAISSDARDNDCAIAQEWDVFANPTSATVRTDRLLAMDGNAATVLGGQIGNRSQPPYSDTEGYYIGGDPDWENISWSFNSSDAVDATVAVRLSGVNWNADLQENTHTINLGANGVQIFINGIAVDLSTVNLYITGGDSWHDWTMVVIDGINLEAGLNTIEIVGQLGGVRPNVNTASVFGAGATLTVVPPATA